MTNELPKSWKILKLSEFTDLVMGQSPPSDTYNSNHNGLPFYQGKAEFGDLYPTPVKWCSKPKKVAPKGSVLISVRAPVGPTNLNPHDSCIGRGLASVKLKYEINERYLLYLLKNYENDLIKKSKGSTFQAISASDLKNLEVVYPPIEEQEIIIVKLDEYLSEINQIKNVAETLQTQLINYRLSVLKYVLEGRLFGNFVVKKEKLGKIYEIIGGGTPSTSNKEYWGGKIPWITSADIDNIGNIKIRRHVTEAGIADSATKIIPKESIMVVTRVGLGKVAQAPFDLCTNQDIQCLINPSEPMNPKYVMYMVKYIAQSFSYKGRGTTITGITKKILEDVYLPLYTLEQQNHAVNFIEQQHSVINYASEYINMLTEKLHTLCSSIRKSAFSGNFTKEYKNE